ncbi:MAG: hypothetical protein J6386_07715 [Candidatus Synoicihabitans palmerolidicus]|nr:hypothetical protein [Candidatus Synoicihabitans palmerolidicus]
MNAEQVLGENFRSQALCETLHVDFARKLGSDDFEIQQARVRMALDRCTTVAKPMEWLVNTGYCSVETYYRWFRFAVIAGWRN